MSNCRSGCKTQDHVSYAECLKAANLRIGYCRSHIGQDSTTEKKWDKELSAYRDARKQGIQPETTKLKDIRAAVDHSNKTGVAYNANKDIV